MSESLRLSYSSMNEVLTCQTRYAHRKVWHTAPDAEDDTEALNLGKAFHQVLERSFHNAFHAEHLKEAMIEFNVSPENEKLLQKMGEKYVRLHQLSGLKVVKVEFEILTTKYRGFVDALMVDDAGGWWVGDLKTAARYDNSLLPRLPQDLQLNLYSSFAEEMQDRIPDLQGKVFRGCRYRVTTKTKDPKSYDIVIPVSVMNPKLSFEVFESVFEIALGIHNGVVPTRNYKACCEYFRPCQFFSKCHNKKFTEDSGVIVLTEEILQETDVL